MRTIEQVQAGLEGVASDFCEGARDAFVLEKSIREHDFCSEERLVHMESVGTFVNKNGKTMVATVIAEIKLTERGN